jgi:hypothetical protein
VPGNIPNLAAGVRKRGRLLAYPLPLLLGRAKAAASVAQ